MLSCIKYLHKKSDDFFSQLLNNYCKTSIKTPFRFSWQLLDGTCTTLIKNSFLCASRKKEKKVLFPMNIVSQLPLHTLHFVLIYVMISNFITWKKAMVYCTCYIVEKLSTKCIEKFLYTKLVSVKWPQK